MTERLPDGTTVKFRDGVRGIEAGRLGIIRGLVDQAHYFSYGDQQSYIVELQGEPLKDHPYTCVAVSAATFLVPVNVQRGCGSMPCECMGTCYGMVPQDDSVIRIESKQKFGV